MWYYVKQVGFGYLYLFFMDMVALGISAMSGTFLCLYQADAVFVQHDEAAFV